jgi:hypothetical protein
MTPTPRNIRVVIHGKVIVIGGSGAGRARRRPVEPSETKFQGSDKCSRLGAPFQIFSSSRPSIWGVTTPYRNEIDPLQERRTSLQAEIAKLREQTTQLDELRSREAALAAELAGVEGRLARGAPKRTLPLLDQARVASPCNAEWNAMLGDERVRRCLRCEKNVYNLSTMQREDAEALLRERLGNDLCIRYYQRADGTILTQDCPEGMKKKRRKKLVLAVASAGAMAAAAAAAHMRPATCTKGSGAEGQSVVMGDWGPGPEVKGEATVVPFVAPIPTIVGIAPPPGDGRWLAGAAPATEPVSPRPTATSRTEQR